jgi:epoxide hydrolase-like predicted phosphatase
VRKAVVCDFGGVLTTPLYESFMHYQEVSGVDFQELVQAMRRIFERTGEHPLFELEKGAISEAQFLETLAREMDRPDGAAHLTSLAETFFGHLSANKPMVDLMASLRERGLRMAILTNNVREWEARWQGLVPELHDIFEFIVDSAFVGMRKPDPEIYELVLSRFGNGVSFEDCVFIDDTDVNCAAAADLGMAAVHFQTNEQAIPEIEALLS